MMANPSLVDTNAPGVNPEAHHSPQGMEPPPSAFENSLVRLFITILQSRPMQSLLLSDLGALMNMKLRHAIKEKGGLRTWIQRYPQHFVIRDQPGKELVTLADPRTDGEANELPTNAGKPWRRASRSSIDNDGTYHADYARNLCSNNNGREGRVENGVQFDDHEVDLGLDRDSEDEYDAIFEVQPILQLRGLPYRAQVDDIVDFLGDHVALLKKPTRNSIELVMQRDGRPSGFARVHFLTAQAARECRDRLHMQRMNERYVEIFLHNEPLSRRKNDGQNYSVHHMPDVHHEKNADGTERDADAEVLRECIAYLKQQGKFVLLSMLGVALSPQSREYLKENDQGLKQFLVNYPELCVEGSKGCEWVGFASDSDASQRQKSALSKTITAAAARPVVGAPVPHRAPPQLKQQEQEQQVQHHATGPNGPQSTTPFQPRLAELLPDGMAPVGGSHPLPPLPIGFQYLPLGLHYTYAVHPQYLQPTHPQQVAPQALLRDDTHQHTAPLHVTHIVPIMIPHAHAQHDQVHKLTAQAPAQALFTPTPAQQFSSQMRPQPLAQSNQHQDIFCRPIAPPHATPTGAQCRATPHSAQRQPIPNRLIVEQQTAKIAPISAHQKPPLMPRTKHTPSTDSPGAAAVSERDMSKNYDSPLETPPESALYESTPSDWGTPPIGSDGWMVHDPWGLTSNPEQPERPSVSNNYFRAKSAATPAHCGRSSASTVTTHALDEQSAATGARLRGYTSDTQDVEFFSEHIDKVLTEDQYTVASSSMDTTRALNAPWRPLHGARRRSNGTCPNSRSSVECPSVHTDVVRTQQPYPIPCPQQPYPVPHQFQYA
eukprot:GEMP01001727.1.p1 GENE.GEMP01001727.1~~GEMP01001727.1.p1  ORF type:complete len:829 (+),score=206.74 GEMP01001727.1:165-2651(+)